MSCVDRTKGKLLCLCTSPCSPQVSASPAGLLGCWCRMPAPPLEARARPRLGKAPALQQRQTDEHAWRDRLATREEEKAGVEEGGRGGRRGGSEMRAASLTESINNQTEILWLKIQTLWNIPHCICVAYNCAYFKFITVFNIWDSGSFKAELEKHLTFLAWNYLIDQFSFLSVDQGFLFYFLKLEGCRTEHLCSVIYNCQNELGWTSLMTKQHLISFHMIKFQPPVKKKNRLIYYLSANQQLWLKRTNSRATRSKKRADNVKVISMKNLSFACEQQVKPRLRKTNEGIHAVSHFEGMAESPYTQIQISKTTAC